MKFQHLAGIEKTGTVPIFISLQNNKLLKKIYIYPGFLDEQTLEMMNAPRCGNQDQNLQNAKTNRRKRYVIGGLFSSNII